MKIKIALVSFLLFAGSVWAESPWYIGIGGGTGEVEVVGHDRGPEVRDVLTDNSIAVNSITAGEPDGTDVWKIFAGYQFNKEWALEASYQDLGKTSGSFTSSVNQAGTNSTLNGKIRSEYDSIATSAVRSWKLHQRFGVFARAGAHYWKHEFHVSGNNGGVAVNDTKKDNGFGALYGGGVVGHVSDSLLIRLEWERFHNIEDEDGIDIKTLNAVYRF